MSYTDRAHELFAKHHVVWTCTRGGGGDGHGMGLVMWMCVNCQGVGGVGLPAHGVGLCALAWPHTHTAVPYS